VLISLAIIGAALLIIGLWLYVGPDTATEKKDFVQAVGVLIAGMAGFIGLYFTWTNLDQTRQTTQRTLKLTEQGQITERFTRAIDQLGATDDDGNPRLEVRLGGIYALERIDKESPDRAYHSTVMEVLTAYVRENAPWPPRPSKSPEEDFLEPPGESASVSTPNESPEQEEGDEQEVEPPRKAPSTDIQAILDVINRREEDDVPEKHRIRALDLRGTELQGANLGGAHLEGAILYKAHLEGAYLGGAYLEGANLYEAHLEGAFLYKAHLEGANLKGAHLEGAILYKAHLEGAFLYEAHLEGANLKGAHLEGANLYGAHLEGTRDLTSEQIKWTIGDEATKVPEHLVEDRPALWSKSLEEQDKIIEARLKQEPKDE